MQNALKSAIGRALEANAWTKFTDPTAGRGQTTFPKGPADQEWLGVRWQYDGEVTNASGVYHKFLMQPNAGKVPLAIKRWREGHGGTHAVMAIALVKKYGTKEDVENGLKEAAATVKD